MSGTRRNTSQRLTLIILLVASLTVITLDYKGDASKIVSSVRNGVRDAVSPIQRVISDGLRPVGDFFAGAVNYGKVERENAILRSEEATLRRDAYENETAEQQLSQLLSEEHLPYVQNLPTLLAQVIGGSTSNFDDTFEIDRGTSSGVGAGMPVVAGPGLIGIVTKAGSSTSVVQTITNVGSQFGVSLGTSGDLAVANGEGAGSELSLSGVTAPTPVHVGELVDSSTLTGASLPAGIPVGTVTSVAGGALTERVLVRPFASLQGMSYVTVLLWWSAP